MFVVLYNISTNYMRKNDVGILNDWNWHNIENKYYERQEPKVEYIIN